MSAHGISSCLMHQHTHHRTNYCDHFQLQCCGSNNYSDFQNSEHFGKPGQPKVPSGCCKKETPECTYEPTPENSNMNNVSVNHFHFHTWIGSNCLISIKVTTLRLIDFFILAIAGLLRGVERKGHIERTPHIQFSCIRCERSIPCTVINHIGHHLSPTQILNF